MLNLFKKCFKNCKYCYGEGNETINNCIECNDNYIFISDSIYKNNCYEKCNFYYYFDESNNYYCTEACPEKYKLIKEKNKCVDKCDNDDTYIYEYNNTCYKNPEEIIKEKISSFIQEFLLSNDTRNNDNIDFDIQDKVQEKIKSVIKNELDTNTLNDGNDIEINVGSVNYTITTTTNQNNNKNNDVSTIDLGECENKLKLIHNISLNDSLYIFKVDLILEHIHKVEYEVYYPFLPYNLTLFNLSDCKNIKIDISIPFEIPKGQINKYNKSSELYNSICVTSTSEAGTDEPYKDRQNNYKMNDSLKVCEEDCDFNDYDINNKKALCSCFTKIKFPAISEIKINYEKMYSNFKNIKNIANFKMLGCIYLLFDKKNIINNSSNYMMLLLLILSLVSLFDFTCHHYLKIKNKINQFSNNVFSSKKRCKVFNINNNQNNNNALKKGNSAKKISNSVELNKKIDKNIPIQLIKKQNNNTLFSFANVNNLVTNNVNKFININEIIKSKSPMMINRNK